MKRTTSIILGIIIVAVGVVFGLNALNITDIDIFFDGWWTLFIIVPCLVSLIGGHDKTGSLIGILVGVLLLLACQDILNFDVIWKLVIPVIIIAIGLKIIFKSMSAGKTDLVIRNGAPAKSYAAVFSGQKLDYTNEIFESAELTAVFGGIECDLRNAVIDRDAVINTTCIFGGVDILLPANVNVKTSSASIFGGMSDAKRRNLPENTVTVYINGTCIFGGTDIK